MTIVVSVLEIIAIALALVGALTVGLVLGWNFGRRVASREIESLKVVVKASDSLIASLRETADTQKAAVDKQSDVIEMQGQTIRAVAEQRDYWVRKAGAVSPS